MLKLNNDTLRCTPLPTMSFLARSNKSGPAGTTSSWSEISAGGAPSGSVAEEAAAGNVVVPRQHFL